jgi:hypothetical protein
VVRGLCFFCVESCFVLIRLASYKKICSNTLCVEQILSYVWFAELLFYWNKEYVLLGIENIEME